MKMKLWSIVSCSMIVLFLSGCLAVSQDRDRAIDEEREREAVKQAQKQGAMAGVIVPPEVAEGAPITGALERPPVETPEGSFTGVLIGSITGTYHYDPFNPRAETVATYHYQESQGIVFHVEDAFTQLSTIHPGDEIDLGMRYAVLTPYHDAMTPITELREIKFNGRTVGTIRTHISLADGTYTSIVPLKVPSSQEAIGEYQVTETVQSGNAKDSKEVKFTVVELHKPEGENLPGTRTYGE